MRTEEIIQNLKYTAKKHSNDRVCTGQTNITSMCKDLIPKMEQLKAYEDAEEQGFKEIRNKAIDEFAEAFIYKAICSGCSTCCNCYENGHQRYCEDYKQYMEIAEQMKGE